MQQQRDHGLIRQARNDIVHEKAREQHINPRELFARAFMEAGKNRSAADIAFGKYSAVNGAKLIPQEVIDFCAMQSPVCSNPNCPDRSLPARFTRMNISGRPTYFCSAECMDSTPRDSRNEAEIAEARGLAILERVRKAMSEAKYVKIPPNNIRPLSGQPRTYFNPDRQMKLVQSLRKVGQIQPGIVRNIPNPEVPYELLDGERRLRGVIEADLPEYRAMLVDIDDEAAPFVISVISNFNREDHTLTEFADAVKKMHEQLRLSMKQIGDILGIHEVEASQLYGLRRLIPEVRDMLDPYLVKGHPLPKSAAIEISKQPVNTQLDLAERMMRNEFTVTSLKEHIREGGTNSGYAPAGRRKLNPTERRRSALARARMAQNSITALARLLREPETWPALQELTTKERQTLIQDLQVVRVNTEECETSLKEVLAE